MPIRRRSIRRPRRLFSNGRAEVITAAPSSSGPAAGLTLPAAKTAIAIRLPRYLWPQTCATCDGKKIDKYKVIAQTEQRIVAFGEDAEGELYIADHEGGGLWQIAPNPNANAPSKFPHNLSETGLFADVARQQSNPGVVPFAINSPQFMDGSISEHFVAIPSADAVTDDKDGNRKFPTGMVLVRTLALDTGLGDLPIYRKVETQL